MESLFFGDLTVEPSVDTAGTSNSKSIKLFFRGKSNHREPHQVLGPYFAQVLGEAKKIGAEIELHFEHIEHLNSSTITAIVHMIREATTQTVRLAVVYDVTQKWQKLSFSALRVLEKDDGAGLRFVEVTPPTTTATPTKQ